MQSECDCVSYKSQEKTTLEYCRLITSFPVHIAQIDTTIHKKPVETNRLPTLKEL